MKKLIQFYKDRRGAVFMIIALCFVTMCGIVAASLDYSRGSLLKSELSAALDSAALAGGTVANSSTMSATVNKYFNVNLPPSYLGSTVDPITVTQSTDKTLLTVAAGAHLKNGMMQIVNWDATNITASSQVTIETKGMELVLVLDNTGSMSQPAGGGQTKLQALQTASNSLLNILYGGHDTAKDLWVSVVPFSQAVNIGTARTSWLTTSTPNTAYDWGTGNSWKGCVEARYSSGHDMTDENPLTVVKFPPYYSSCVAWSSSNVWYNSWFGSTSSTSTILSGGGSASPSLTLKTGCNGAQGSRTYTSPLDTLVTVSGNSKAGTYNWGPNQYCPKTAILPMTASKTTVSNTINSMIAIGDTDINLGLVWGWRMISPNWRLTTGATGNGTSLWGGDMDLGGTSNNSPDKKSLPLDYKTPLMNKVIVLLTDGDNSYLPGNYTAYGTLSGNNVGASCSSSVSSGTTGYCSYNTPSAEKKLDDKTKALCDTLKATDKGVIIYTIALGTSISNTGKSLLQYCASKPEYYFESPTGSDLQSAFTTIGDNLSNLRISQ